MAYQGAVVNRGVAMMNRREPYEAAGEPSRAVMTHLGAVAVPEPS